MPSKKLIEVALPLEAINKAAAREKSIRHGHPSTLHLWWARRPLAAARAVIFAQMVDDPSTYVSTLHSDSKLKRKAEAVLRARHKVWEEASALARRAKGSTLSTPDPGPAPTLDEALADQERERLFRIIEELVLWENTTNELVLKGARDEIWASWRRACAENVDHPRAKELFDRRTLPPFHDPFAGGGALPLEAQRLGLESYASDLNPVAVLINKAMIEVAPKFVEKPPVNSDSRTETSLLDREWKGALGLAEDVRYYGQWMREQAEKRIGHLYPKIEVTNEMAKRRPDLAAYVGKKLTVIAWVWARTVASPNPAYAQVDVPLASTFMLSTKVGKEAYIEPVIENGSYRFSVKLGKPKDAAAARNGTKASGRGANFLCVMSGEPISADYIKGEAKSNRMGARLMAIVAEGERERVYLAPTEEHEKAALEATPDWKPDVEFFQQALGFRVGNYGMAEWGDLFTNRQLVALTSFSDLVHEARVQVERDALESGYLPTDPRGLADGGCGTAAYADAVALFLAFGVSRSSDYWSSLCIWRSDPKNLGVGHVFSKQTLSMVWDFAEGNPLSNSSGNWILNLDWIVKVIAKIGAGSPGHAQQGDAQTFDIKRVPVVSTDPPYYDNVGYADLSDFFYVWLRPSLKSVFPNLFATVAVPKAEELVATPARHGGRDNAESFFLHGMTQVMHRLAESAHPAFPVTIFYAFKQAETEEDDGASSTGWETFLGAVINAGFGISGTWPVRTELGNRTRSMDSNALASSIVLVCRPRSVDAVAATRREFVAALRNELPVALAYLQRGNIAPVDLAQAAIGPGMAIYTRYTKVLDAEGKPLTVRDALALINQTLDEALAEQEGDFDPDSRFAIAWFEQYGFEEGEFGIADVLARAKVTAVDSLVEAGIANAGRGKVRLMKPEELRPDWDPTTDARLTAWEIVHHLIRVVATKGEAAAAHVVAALGAKAEISRELAYRLYTMCERKKRATEALAYNGLVQSWPEIVRLAREGEKAPAAHQGGLFAETEE